MGYREYQLAMGFISEELPEGVTFEDVDAESFYSTIYYKDSVPVVAYFYSKDNKDEPAVEAIRAKIGPGYAFALSERGLGHFVLGITPRKKRKNE